MRTHILVAHVPVWAFPVRHHFPHDNAVAPHVARRGELPVGDGLRGRPANGDLSSLRLIGSCYFLSGDTADTHTHRG